MASKFAGLMILLALAVVLFPPLVHGYQQGALDRMPEDPAKQLIATKCSTCHEPSRAFDRTRTPDEWNDVVVLMRDFGADISAADQKTIVTYLSKNYGRTPAPPKAVAPPAPMDSARNGAAPASAGASTSAQGAGSARAAASPEAASTSAAKAAPAAGASAPAPAAGTSASAGNGRGRALLDTKCTMCHNLDQVFATKRTPAQWQELINTMKEFGADVSGADEKAIRDYLSKNFAP
ncbi:MAG: hypothetical protein AB7O65_02330 [Candidatus Korobacteraceae bacterium]